VFSRTSGQATNKLFSSTAVLHWATVQVLIIFDDAQSRKEFLYVNKFYLGLGLSENN
jgi:hypothetical protein